MKKYVYQVAGREFVDGTAFGIGWEAAKAAAAELKAPIYRLVIKNDEAVQEVYIKGGCFIRADLASNQSIKVF